MIESPALRPRTPRGFETPEYLAALTSFRLSFPVFKGAPDALWRQRQVSDAHAGGAIDGIANRGRDGKNSALGHAAYAEGAGAIPVFDQQRVKLFRHFREGRDPIVDQIGIEQLAVVVNQLLEKGVADALHRRAFLLSDAMLGMDSLADIGDGDESFQFHLPRLMVDIDFGGAHAHFPEDGQFAVRDLGPRLAASDHFAARAFTEAPLE